MPRSSTLVADVVVAVSVVVATCHPGWADRIELEIFTDRGSPPAAAHEWMQTLQKVPLDRLRFRQDHLGQSPQLILETHPEGTIFQITGVIQDGRVLHVPGASFARHDMDRFRDWLTALPQRATSAAADQAFGLTAEQLVHLHQRLKQPVRQPTQGMPLGRFIQGASAQLPLLPNQLPIAPDDKIAEELQGLSYGTALAAALRPWGLVLVPSATGSDRRDVALEIRSVRDADEIWPIGWPRQAPVNKLAPKLVDFLEVEINDIPLAEALAAIQPRLNIPFLFDQNGMARQEIDPAIAKVTFPARKTYYKKILSNLLYQAKLTSELRVDEAGKPFLWISPVKR